MILICERIEQELKARRANYADFESVSDETCGALASWITDIVRDLHKDEELIALLAPRVEGLVHNRDDGKDTVRMILDMLTMKMINGEA